MPDAPTPRRDQHLDPDHPLADTGVPEGDCISDVDPQLLDEVAAWHNDADPPDTEVNPEELV